MITSYKISLVDIFTHSGKCLISTDDFYKLENHFGMEAEFFYAKIDNAHIPVYPENTIPRHTVVLSELEADRFEIEEEYDKTIFFMNPEAIQWL